MFIKILLIASFLSVVVVSKRCASSTTPSGPILLFVLNQVKREIDVGLFFWILSISISSIWLHVARAPKSKLAPTELMLFSKDDFISSISVIGST